MTDARLPGRWLTDPNLEALSDRLWRIHTGALMWSAEQGTDGLIPRRTLRLLHPDTATPDDANALVGGGLWSVEGDDFRVLDWEHSQSLAAEVERRRELDRERKRRQRSRDGVTRDNMQDDPRDVQRESSRQGQDRRGEGFHGSEVSTSETRDAADQAVVEAEIVDDDAFDRVWAVWPKKTSKKVARLRFAASAKRHPQGEPGLTADIVEHARAYVQHAHPVQFVPMLSTWLNGERWQDDLPGPRHERPSAADHNAGVLGRYT